MDAGRPDPETDGILGKRALDEGLITLDQLAEALRRQVRGTTTLGRALIEAGYVTEPQWEALAAAHRSGAPLPPAPGRLARLGKFVLLRELGRGAMGVVYEAQDTELDRTVALKMLLADPNRDPRETGPERERFLREARLAASLSPHPNIVGVHEAGVAGETLYLAMERVDGVSMTRWRKSGSITTRQIVSVIRDVALAVHHAHAQGVIHRDLKPENILVDRQNRPHVTDFGLAKRLGPDAGTLTAAGTALGTPAYMSPEQIQGRAKVDPRTDVYALGVMLYEALTGRRPFEGETAFEIMTKAVRDPVPVPSKHTRLVMNPLHFKSLELVCLKALAKDPEDRYATALDFAMDLTKWLRGERFEVRLRWPRKTRRLLTALAAAAALAGAAIAALLLRDPHKGELARARELLRQERFDDAIEAFERILAAAPSHSRAQMGREEARRALDARAGTTREIVIDAAAGVRMTFAFIRPGTFRMGDPRDAGEKRVHPVMLRRSYWMQTTEVTQAQWQAVMGSNPSRHKGPDRPVESVSWNDAVAFAERLSARLGGLQVSLPTEAEWEYACRAGGGGRWTFGDDPSLLDAYAWHRGNSGGETHPVGRKKPNAWGLYDIHGNALEWCLDWLAPYPSDAAVDPRGPEEGVRKVLRGGYYDDPVRLTEASTRNWGIPPLVHPGCGLRLVLRQANIAGR